jgi:hypothetical protein
MGNCLAGLIEAFRTFGSAKELARAGGVSVFTAQRYRSGYTTPDVITLTRIMAQSRAVADAVLRMAGLDDRSMDIEEARLLRSFLDLQAKRLALHDAMVEQGVPLVRAASTTGRGTTIENRDRPVRQPARKAQTP